VQIFCIGLNGSNLIREAINRKGYPIRVLVRISKTVITPARLYTIDVIKDSFFKEPAVFIFGSDIFIVLLTPLCRIELKTM